MTSSVQCIRFSGYPAGRVSDRYSDATSREQGPLALLGLLTTSISAGWPSYGPGGAFHPRMRGGAL
eukprot:scaffold3120_cov26-Tisochrysis_lutea.AAC.1